MASYNCIYALRLHITNLHTILKLFSLKQSPNYLAKFRKKNLFCRADFKKKNWKAYLNNFWTPPPPDYLENKFKLLVQNSKYSTFRGLILFSLYLLMQLAILQIRSMLPCLHAILTPKFYPYFKAKPKYYPLPAPHQSLHRGL